MALARPQPATRSPEATSSPVREGDAAGPGPIWVMAAVGAAGAAVLYALLVWGLPAPRLHLPFLPVAALFAVAETVVVHLDVDGHAYTYSAVEVPLVLGLVALDPRLLVAAWVLGGLISLGLVHRQPRLKLAYNLACFAVESVAATLVCRAIAPGTDPVASRSLAAVFAAATVASAISIASVLIAVSRMERARTREARVRYAGFALVSTWVTAALTLIGVVLEQAHPQSLWLLAPPAAGAWAVQRAFTLRARRGGTVPAGAADLSDLSDLSERGSPPQPAEARTGPATHDPLTGLVDEKALLEHLGRLLTEPGDSDLACLVLGLQDLTAVNDRYGEPTGNQLLVVTAQRLAGCLREGDLAARLDGDRLAVVARVSPDDGAREAAALAQRISESMGRPASLGAQTVTATTEVGIALRREGDRARGLLEAAQLALDAAEPARR